MNRRNFTLSTASLLAGSLLPIATSAEASGVQIGESVRIPSTTLVNGTVQRTGDYQGKVLIVEKFATWCPFCKVQNPKLDALYRAKKTFGLEILLLSIDKNSAEVSKYLNEKRYALPAAMMTREWQSVLGEVKGLPVIWVIGRDGKLKQIESGELMDEDITELAKWL